MMPSFALVWVFLIVRLAPGDIGKLFGQLPPSPKKIFFSNSISFNNSGGHLQGVQPYFFEGEEYLFFSGSSNTYAYLAIAHGKEVKKLQRLMHRPFKHAGGFQIHRNWLAVGIEDNEARDASFVHIYKLGDPLSVLKAPVAVIERSGNRERATAGAVAVHQDDQTLWLVVGDWSNRHLDFYSAEIAAPGEKIRFHKTGEVDMTNHPKDDWVDPVSRSFQNINLFRIGGQFYLVGLGADQDSNRNVLDVFVVEDISGPRPVVRMVYSRTFDAIADAKFRWGAGVSLDSQGQPSVYSCGDNIRSNVAVAIYR